GGEIVRELMDIGDQISDGSETGLLGLAFSPDGGLLYLSYSDKSGDNNIVEFAMDGDSPDLETRRTVLTIDQPQPNHNGGDIAFGPDDLLYVALGDGGGGGDPFANGQDTSTLLGSILRIDPGADPYSIPSDNPFADGGGAPEIFLYGVRNPWRISFDRATGDLWIGDVGQDAVEEIDVLYASEGGGRGANLGWSRVEGTLPFNATGPPAENYVPPVYEYFQDEGCSVTGGHVYRGASLPSLFGSYIFADFCSGRIWGLASNEGQAVLGRFDLGLDIGSDGLASFGEGPDGEIYVLSFGGRVFRIDPAS
ncbi:MAG: sorbosone dehydrogenase family protein, partial [Acidimicrobiales bacterium]